MPANANDQCCLYWISDAGCTDKRRHGYIGITKNEASRESAWRRSGRFPTNFRWKILFRGTRLECAAEETKYRPEEYIGWNRARGGGRWRKR
jgi:hypothetical protein